MSEIKLLDIFTDNFLMTDKPADRSGSLIDHVFIKKN